MGNLISNKEQIMKLLIADDNEEMRNMLKFICEAYFDEMMECSDGEEAIEIYKLHKPDWVLMDIKMDKKDGINATKEIKEKNPEAKIIIVSQYDDDDIIRTSIQSGAVDFVSKEDLPRIEDIIRNFR